MNDRDTILISKLDEFIRRYYKNQLLKGSLYTTGILLSAFLSVTLLEYFGEFNSLIRGILFFGFLGAAGFVLSRYIITPLLKLNRIGHRISYEQAAFIIGKHFGDVQDKLLNVLQMQNHQVYGGSEELLLAGIQQKIKELQPVPFAAAINLHDNKRYLPYVLPVFFLTAILVIAWPHVFTKSTARLLHYQRYYEKEMPFRFEIQNHQLRALQTEDYRLSVKVNGQEIPSEIMVLVNGIEYKLEKENNFQFYHTFSNVQKTLTFQLGAAGFLSKEYELEVLPKPSLLEFSMKLSYPGYLHKADEVVANTGDIIIPQGTKITWSFHTKNADRLNLFFGDSAVKPEMVNDNAFSFSKRFMQDQQYQIRPANALVPFADSVSYKVNVVPDQYPQIEVTEKADSLDPRNIYFSGALRDDYGFTQLQFKYQKNTVDSTGKSISIQGFVPVNVQKHEISQSFYYYLDVSSFSLGAGDKMEYYFEVKDNDGVNGPKAARSHLMSFKAPTKDEIAENRNKNNSEIKKDLEESIAKAKQLQKDINELSKKINDKKQLGYEEKKKLEDLLKKQQSLQSKIEEMRQENQLNNQQQNEFNQVDESILEKQKELEKLFENVMTPEMKKLFDELNKMLDKLDKNQVQEKLDELKLSNKDIEKELDRNLEAFRQLEVQQKMQEAIDKLDELSKKQDELSKESSGKKEEEKKSDDAAKDQKKTENAEQKDAKKEETKSANTKASENKPEEKKSTAAELNKKQDELNKEFDKLKKELEELKDKNKALEEPNKMPDTDSKSEEISKDMQNSSSQLQKNNKKSAAKSQKSASEKMEEMKESMEKAMEEEAEEQEEENAQALRQILENLLNLSFSQEELLKVLPKTRVDNPQYLAIPQNQNKLKEDSKLIEDSLLALSKRVPKISALVNREISSIHLNMEKTVKSLSDRNVGESVMRMQSTMTSVNNLALLLNESLEQMQQQMKDKKDSKGQKAGKCKKPGSGDGKKPSNKGNSTANVRKMQEQLNKQLQDLKNALEKGQKPGEKPGEKPGQKSGMGPGGLQGSSEQFAKMAAQQEALRRQMQSMMEKLKNKGKNPGGDISAMMEETEKELVNKQLTNSTLKRQQEILTRLLESEKAEKEREQDEQRKSTESKSENFGNPERFLEYKRLKEKEMELLNTVPPNLNPYYKDKVNLFFNSLSK